MYRVRQQGVALITALLVVALAVVAAASMASRQQLDIRRTGNLLHGEQAYAYVSGAESWARVVLARDLNDSKIDTLEEDWSTRPPASMVEGGIVTGCILDLQGRFNLNSLVVSGKENKSGIERYKRLLEALDLDVELVDALVDWMDENVNTRFPDGAEDDYYLLLDPPYRTSNRLLANLSELRLVKGYEPEVIDVLQEHVTALPDSQTPLNINTASADVLRTVAEDISLKDAQNIVEEREGLPDGGFKDVGDFLKLDELAGKKQPPDPATLSVQSEWFVVLSTSYIGQASSRLTAQLHRTARGTSVVQRRRAYADGLACRPVGSGEAPGTEAAGEGSAR